MQDIGKATYFFFRQSVIRSERQDRNIIDIKNISAQHRRMRLTPLALHRSITPKIVLGIWRAVSAFHQHGFKRTALAQADLWAAIQNADPQGLSSAISRKADIDRPHGKFNRMTPLAMAVLNRWTNGESGMAILETLLQHGCNPNQRLYDRPWTTTLPNPGGEPILLRALRHGDFEAAYALCRFGASMDECDDHGLSGFSLCEKMQDSVDYRREAYARFRHDACAAAASGDRLAIEAGLAQSQNDHSGRTRL